MKAPLRDNFVILPQPTETSCGPTCLQAVYRHWGLRASLPDLIDRVPVAPNGGTYSVMLACDALQQGFAATIYSYNLKVFDPTWRDLSMGKLIDKLRARSKRISSKRALTNLHAYINFLRQGGRIRFDELTPKLLQRILKQHHPIIAGLSSNHLYRDCRTDKKNRPDDIGGQPEGHFVVLADCDPEKKRFLVFDPYAQSPLSDQLKYWVGPHRLINSIMLGIVTYDANLLVIQPRKKSP